MKIVTKIRFFVVSSASEATYLTILLLLARFGGWESWPGLFLGAAAFSLIPGAVISGIILGGVEDSFWFQLKKEGAKPFGEIRVDILKRKRQLETVIKELGTSNDGFKAAIVECDKNLQELDEAALQTHKTDLDNVQKQSELVAAILAAVQDRARRKPIVVPEDRQDENVDHEKVPQARTRLLE